MVDNNIAKERPISPHLQIYKWSITMLSSILHRVTGVILSVGTLFLTAWLVSLAYNYQWFIFLDSLVNNIVIKLALFLYSFALILHAIGGLRHLFWDADPNLLKKECANKAAYLTIFLSIAITVFVWVVGYFIR